MNKKSSVLITGAAGGIGEALVKGFHQAGYFVIASDVVEINKDLPCDHFVQADLQQFVEDKNYAAGVLQQIKNEFPDTGLKALVNNAATQVLAACDELSRESWQQSLNVNLLAPFFLTQGLLAELELASGSVVNISSIHARLSKKGFTAYATSKAALSALTRNMALDMGDKIRINAIEPAAVRTKLLMEGFRDKLESMQQLAACHPLGRIAEAEEIANVALFLCSEKAGFLQGSIIPVDGGLTGRLYDPA